MGTIDRYFHRRNRQSRLEAMLPDHDVTPLATGLAMVSPKVVPNDTRAAALDAIKDKAGALRERCLEALSDAMLTADEVADKVGESVLSIRPRMTELAQAKRIIKTPYRRPNASGRQAAVWMTPA